VDTEWSRTCSTCSVLVWVLDLLCSSHVAIALQTPPKPRQFPTRPHQCQSTCICCCDCLTVGLLFLCIQVIGNLLDRLLTSQPDLVYTAINGAFLSCTKYPFKNNHGNTTWVARNSARVSPWLVPWHSQQCAKRKYRKNLQLLQLPFLFVPLACSQL
jgi:hypothetical protein